MPPIGCFLDFLTCARSHADADRIGAFLLRIWLAIVAAFLTGLALTFAVSEVWFQAAPSPACETPGGVIGPPVPA